MSLHRRNPRRDASEPEVIEALKAGGATVQQLSGEGVPDLLVGYRYRNRLLEVKSGGNGLTASQDEWHRRWSGERVDVVRNGAQARKLLKLWDLEAESTRIVFPDPVQDQADGVREEEA